MAGVNCGKLDLTKISQDELITINDKTWVKTDVDEKIYIVNGKPHAVIKFSDMCIATVCDDQQNLKKPLANRAGLIEANQDGAPTTDCPEGSESCSQDKTRSLTASVTNSSTDVIQAQSAVDASSANAFGWQGAAVKPIVAVVPMRSNIKTYGPYASSNFGSSCGGTQVEMNTDLAPWVFGSTAGMNAAGSSIVENMAIGLVKAETGNITIPGLPLSAFSSMGVALGGAGPTLSSINFSYGSSGISTSYEFRTFTPKFGGLNRHLIDRIKNIAKNRTEQLRFIRSNQITQNKISRKIKNIANHPRNIQAPKGTLQRVLIGEIYDWEKVNDSYSQCSIVGIDSLRKSVAEMSYDYSKKAYISLDALYGPISKSGDGGLPQYASFQSGVHKSSPQQAQPPFAIQENYPSNQNPFVSGLNQYNLDISQRKLDPITNKFDENQHHHTGPGIGHVIDIIGREQQIPDSGIITNFYHLDDADRYSDDYRLLGMRGPLLLHSWGYDTEGKPIPNEVDIENESKEGKFKSEYLKDRFLKDWLGKPSTWPVAPIDLRFDRKRGLWVSPPGYKIVVAILEEKLAAYGSAKASLINNDTTHNINIGPDLYNKDGSRVEANDQKNSQAKIKVVDRIGREYPSNTRLYCYYDTYKSEYIVLDASPKRAIRFRLIELCDSPAQPDYGDTWTQYGGYGDKFPNNHVVGVRIDCEGNPINNKDEPVTYQDILDEEKRKDIFINLYDTCGRFGAAYAYYNANGGPEAFSQWMERAATGFALLCDPNSNTTCSLGEQTTQCTPISLNYDTYDIIFLDGYARFIECTLKQNLYSSQQEVTQRYSNDAYKVNFPKGNASAEIKEFYGDPGNGGAPRFYTNDNYGLKEIDFRVFDPFEGLSQDRNPFAHLKEGDKVLAVFDEKRKKYIIYNSVKKTEKVIKFALVDNKDIGDRTSRAVLVDDEAYPIDANGNRLTEYDFTSNFITVVDPFAVHGYSQPNPSYHNFGTTGFGPALGSDKFNEHLNGIELASGDYEAPAKPNGYGNGKWTAGPFIGYAIQRDTNINNNYYNNNVINEIFFLESFAQTIKGKICSIKATSSNTGAKDTDKYYLGVLEPNGFVNGRIPFTRTQLPENKNANLAVVYPMDQHYGGRYVAGDFHSNYQGNTKNVYNHVDGCRFFAKLDHVRSTVNKGQERLFYTTIECDHIATNLITVISKIEDIDKLNKDEVNHADSQDPYAVNTNITSQSLNGWIWDKDKSPKHYRQITIANKLDWRNKALILPWKNNGILHIKSTLVGFSTEDNGPTKEGQVTYKVDHAGTIAQIALASVPSDYGGVYGLVGEAEKRKKDLQISKFDNPKFFHGLDPLNAESALKDSVENQPKIVVHNDWMTYDGSQLATVYDENDSNKFGENKYKVIYAREAPVIITGKAAKDFKPTDANKITIEINDNNLFASCPNSRSNPMPTLLVNVKNPMGYGALKGDFVTIQRVNSSIIDLDANYYYMVIGTGDPYQGKGNGYPPDDNSPNDPSYSPYD